MNYQEYPRNGLVFNFSKQSHEMGAYLFSEYGINWSVHHKYVNSSYRIRTHEPISKNNGFSITFLAEDLLKCRIDIVYQNDLLGLAYLIRQVV